MSKRKRPGAYSIGYGTPPKHTQFKPGQSGNPKGRPMKKLPTTMGECMEQVLHKPVVVLINGKPTKTTKALLLCEQLVNRAVSGTMGAAKLVMESAPKLASFEKMMQQIEAEKEAERDPKEPVVIRLRIGDMNPNRPIIDSSISKPEEDE